MTQIFPVFSQFFYVFLILFPWYNETNCRNYVPNSSGLMAAAMVFPMSLQATAERRLVILLTGNEHIFFSPYKTITSYFLAKKCFVVLFVGVLITSYFWSYFWPVSYHPKTSFVPKSGAPSLLKYEQHVAWLLYFFRARDGMMEATAATARRLGATRCHLLWLSSININQLV